MSFYQKLFFPNQTPSCICSMCLYCKGNINAYTKALLGENCPNSCHLVRNYYFQIKLLHAYVQYVYIVVAKHQIVPSKAVVGVDRPVFGL